MMRINDILTGKNGVRSRFNADGDENEGSGGDMVVTQTGKRRRRFVSVFGYAMTPAEVAILILCVLWVFRYIK